MSLSRYLHGPISATPFREPTAAASLLRMASTLSDLSFVGLLILGISLAVAFGFEFVNGFHDTSNAVATVIYTHSLKPVQAVVWSGLWNFLGVMYATTTGLAVAFSIVHLLPVESNVAQSGAPRIP
jgi:PiT family inorganic phosphate transporter